ncbi:hypothetical protein AJ78_03299 [Emergomyces pasteurianus Ep9510]|uniref:Thioredoxin-like fold domain-containing protein n=1 Tax=Emergomyces pasteurianus Ep9510 TaxID=1447872 RepID=A0A1J9PKX3_9EURO|nr:hypothetical protein AJ78_03299 [Emergomyces pasteurianus Ep9510]
MDDRHISQTGLPHHSHDTSDAQEQSTNLNAASHSGSASPSESVLKAAAKIPILDVDGNELLFEDLYKPSGPGKKKKRTLIIFIRHFFCGSCQEYVKAVSSSFSAPSQLPSDTAIAIVGCGASSLIALYKDLTNCAFPVYTDPTKCLHALFDMKRTLYAGTRTPDYFSRSIFYLTIQSIVQTLSRLWKGDMLQSGDKWQNGGELLFEAEIINETEDGEEEIEVQVPFSHIMADTRNHTEIPVLRTILGLSEEQHGKSLKIGSTTE